MLINYLAMKILRANFSHSKRKQYGCDILVDKLENWNSIALIHIALQLHVFYEKLVYKKAVLDCARS